jgi:mRNA-degrading endonuclease RelE of RelBE toxin-antitoxin system
MTFEFTSSASKAIRKLNEPDKSRVLNGIEKLPYGDIVRLQGNYSKEYYRLRVGDRRVIFCIAENSRIMIHDILPRGEAYKKGVLQ